MGLRKQDYKKIVAAIHSDKELQSYGVTFVRWQRGRKCGHRGLVYLHKGKESKVVVSGSPSKGVETMCSIVVQHIKNRCRKAEHG